jgi:hypothetical protein
MVGADSRPITKSISVDINRIFGIHVALRGQGILHSHRSFSLVEV